jgi:hypothetical protein
MTSETEDSRMRAADRLREMISSYSLTLQEKERREQAAIRLRERCLSIPYYAERDRKEGMEFFRNLHASAILSD